MPTPPQPNETKQSFLNRCIPYLIKEGKERSQAAGHCYGLWNQRHSTNKKAAESIKKR